MGLNPYQFDDLNVNEKADLLAYNNIREMEEAEQMNILGARNIM